MNDRFINNCAKQPNIPDKNNQIISEMSGIFISWNGEYI